MGRKKAVVVARSFALLAVATATTNRLLTGVCVFALVHLLERHWEMVR